MIIQLPWTDSQYTIEEEKKNQTLLPLLANKGMSQKLNKYNTDWNFYCKVVPKMHICIVLLSGFRSPRVKSSSPDPLQQASKRKTLKSSVG